MVVEIVRQAHLANLIQVHANAAHVIGFKVTYEDLEAVAVGIAGLDRAHGLAKRADGHRLVAEGDRLATFDGHHLACDAILVLKAGISDGRALDSCGLGQQVGGFKGSEPALGDSVDGIRTVAEKGIVIENFADAEIVLGAFKTHLSIIMLRMASNNTNQ